MRISNAIERLQAILAERGDLRLGVSPEEEAMAIEVVRAASPMACDPDEPIVDPKTGYPPGWHNGDFTAHLVVVLKGFDD